MRGLNLLAGLRSLKSFTALTYGSPACEEVEEVSGGMVKRDRGRARADVLTIAVETDIGRRESQACKCRVVPTRGHIIGLAVTVVVQAVADLGHLSTRRTTLTDRANTDEDAVSTPHSSELGIGEGFAPASRVGERARVAHIWASTGNFSGDFGNIVRLNVRAQFWGQSYKLP